MSTFPTLRLGLLQNLRDLKRRYAADDKLFELEDCPYDNETKAILREILEVSVNVVEVEKVVEVEVAAKSAGVTNEDMGMVEDELRLCLEEVRNLNKETEGVAAKIDDETRIKIIRAKGALLEQVIKLRERTMSTRRAAEFETTVIDILEDLVTEDDRAEFLKRLEKFK